MQRDEYTEVLSTEGHMETLIKDIRYGIRGLLSQPGFAAIIILTLALGIGANTSIFSVTDKLLIRALAVKNPGQLVLINSISVSPRFVSNAFSYPTFTDYRDQNHVFSGLVAFSRTRLELEANGRIERGRIKHGATQSKAEAGMDLLAQQIKAANTPAGTITKGMPFSEQHIKFEAGGKGSSILRKEFSTPLKLLMAVVGLVLILACANVAGLLMARGVARRKEMAVRATLGASGWRLARQLLTESLLLAALGGLGGLLLAPWLIALLVNTQARLNSARPLLTQTLDLRVLAFTSVITVPAGFAFGVVPAWRTSRKDLIPALKHWNGGSGAGQFGVGLRGFLVVGRLAVTVVVLCGGGLCIKSLRNLLAIDPGYETERLLVVPVELDEKKYDEAHARVFKQQVFERLAA